MSDPKIPRVMVEVRHSTDGRVTYAIAHVQGLVAPIVATCAGRVPRNEALGALVRLLSSIVAAAEQAME